MDLTSEMNAEIIDSSSGKFCTFKKVGRLVFAVIYFAIKSGSLTGNDLVIPIDSIPSDYRPIMYSTFFVSARDNSYWGDANFYPSCYLWTSEGINLVTGKNKNNILLANGFLIYIT